MTVELCLIGVGNFARVIYNKMQQVNGCEVKYCYHPKEEKAKRFDLERGTSDLKKALGEVDGVLVVTPNDAHFGNVKECLKADKHIFVEKPVTSLYRDALKLKGMIKKDLVFMVGHNQRRESYFRYAKKLLNKNKLGKIVSAYFNLSHGGAFSFAPEQWRYSLKRHREGPLITAGVHLMDTTHYLFGEVDSVYARISNISKQTEAPDSNAVILGLKNGASVFMQANYNMPSEESYTIHGTEGTIYVNRGEFFLRMGRDKGVHDSFVPSKPSPIKLKKIDSIKEELTEFRDAIRFGTKVETGFKEGLNALALIEACYRSNRTNKAVFMRSFRDYHV